VKNKLTLDIIFKLSSEGITKKIKVMFIDHIALKSMALKLVASHLVSPFDFHSIAV